jgi:two-component system LytT family response regulator
VPSVALGVEAIRTHAPQIVFLDIEMPNESGFELFNKIESIHFEVIFITAFSSYAVKAFKVNALDYLLKPIDLDELHSAIEKAVAKIKQGRTEEQTQSLIDKLKGISKPNKIGLPMSEGSLFITIGEIIRCESESNYTNIFLETGKKYLICRTLKEVEESLTGHTFLRVHRSHLINVEKIAVYSKNDGGIITMSDHSKVPVSRHEKEALEKHLKSM